MCYGLIDEEEEKAFANDYVMDEEEEAFAFECVMNDESNLM